MCRPDVRPHLALLAGTVLLVACSGDPLPPATEGAALLPNGAYGQWLWSRDGSEIIYLTNPYAVSPAVVGAVNTATGAIRTLASSAGPGGRRILNRGLARSHEGIEVVLSTDGSYVYYLSTTSPQHQAAEEVQLHRVRLHGTTPPELVASGIGAQGYAVSPDMSRVAYNAGGGVHLLDVTTGESEAISTTGSYGVVPDSWGPDGRSVLLMQSRPGSAGRGFMWVDLTTRESRQWSLPPAFHTGVPPEPHPVLRWTGTGPVVLVTNEAGTELARCVLDTGTCTTVRALGGDDVASAVSWSAGGTHVVFWRSRCTRWEPNTFWGGTYCTRYANDLRLLDVDRGEERSVRAFAAASGGGDVPVFAPDSRRIAYTAGWVDRPAGHGLHVQTLP